MNASKQNADRAISKTEAVKKSLPAADAGGHKHLEFVLQFLGRARAKLPNEESFPNPEKPTPEPLPEPAPSSS